MFIQTYIYYVQNVLIHADLQAQFRLQVGAFKASSGCKHLFLFVSQSLNSLLNLGPSLCNIMGLKNSDDFVLIVLCISETVKQPL